MRCWKIIVGVVLASVTVTPLSARQTYASYEGTDAIQIGVGGTRITKNGIDYWTTGSPARRFQILGILTDARKNRLTDGNVLGSKSVAEKTLAAGGDAVIIDASDTRSVGFAHSSSTYFNGNNALNFGSGHVIDRTTTQLIVIKYLPETK